MGNDTQLSLYSLDDQIIGFICVLLPLSIMLFYIPCLYVMATDAELKKHSCLRVMFHLGICDQFQLIGALIGGFWSMTGWGYTVNYWVNKYVVVFTSLVGWHGYIVFINLLGFNRFVNLCLSAIQQDRFFSGGATTGWIVACWLYVLAWVIFYCTPYVTWLYQPAIFVYFYDMSTPLVALSMELNWWNCLVHQVATIVWYIAIYVSMKLQIANISHASEAVRKKEKILLAQSAIICFMLVLADSYWHNALDIMCPKVGAYCFAIGNILIVMNTGVNPFVYLTLNQTISGKVRAIFACSNGQVGPVATSKAKPNTKWDGTGNSNRSIRRSSNRSAASQMNLNQLNV